MAAILLQSTAAGTNGESLGPVGGRGSHQSSAVVARQVFLTDGHQAPEGLLQSRGTNVRVL